MLDATVMTGTERAMAKETMWARFPVAIPAQCLCLGILMAAASGGWMKKKSRIGVAAPGDKPFHPCAR